MEKTPLFKHTPHPHTTHNANVIHASSQGGFNQQAAVRLTRIVGTMWAAYTFIALAIVGLLAILGILSPQVALLISWASQTLIQLVMLPIIMVGQNVLGRHAEIQADEAFKTTQNSYHDLEQLIAHLDAQDKEMMRQGEALNTIVETLTRAARRVRGKSLD